MTNDMLWPDDDFPAKYQQLTHEQRARVHRLVDDMLAARRRFDWCRLAAAWPNRVWDVVAEEMDGFDFEDFVAILLALEGVSYAPNLRRTADKGVDLFRITAHGVETIIECKLRRKRDVGSPVVQSLAGACDRHGIPHGRIYTNRDFTSEAKAACAEIHEASSLHIDLVNQTQLDQTLKGPRGEELRALLRTPNLSGLQDMLRGTGRSEQYVRNRTMGQLKF
ncbi:MAG: restriction endonuclease [Armatimonadota bacterium]